MISGGLRGGVGIMERGVSCAADAVAFRLACVSQTVDSCHISRNYLPVMGSITSFWCWRIRQVERRPKSAFFQPKVPRNKPTSLLRVPPQARDITLQ